MRPHGIMTPGPRVLVKVQQLPHSSCMDTSIASLVHRYPEDLRPESREISQWRFRRSALVVPYGVSAPDLYDFATRPIAAQASGDFERRLRQRREATRFGRCCVRALRTDRRTRRRRSAVVGGGIGRHGGVRAARLAHSSPGGRRA